MILPKSFEVLLVWHTFMFDESLIFVCSPIFMCSSCLQSYDCFSVCYLFILGSETKINVVSLALPYYHS